MPSLYTYCDYDCEWPAQFALEATRLQQLLGDEIVIVHHIGSTSVPGLASKPIIDLLVEVRDIVRIDALTGRLQEAGYRAWGEYGLPGRRFFTRDRGPYRTHNIHMYQVGDPDLERHLAFCAYLRAHSDTAAEYAALKRECYARFPANVECYNDCKNDWIKRLEPIAIEWYRRQG